MQSARLLILAIGLTLTGCPPPVPMLPGLPGPPAPPSPWPKIPDPWQHKDPPPAPPPPGPSEPPPPGLPR
jgi:hypothetical protein